VNEQPTMSGPGRQADQLQPAPGTGRRSGRRRVLWVLGLVLVVYPLSIGPMAKLSMVTGTGSKVVEIVYAPLIVAAKVFPPLARFVDWYLDEVWKTLPKG
jgi:hypothetical protein